MSPASFSTEQLAARWHDAVQFTLSYINSVYQNSLADLAVFIVLGSGWFLGRHIWSSLRMRHARNRISMVLGGWGTRGKSGTERLKAGLINALGHPLVSKTTGCEAMFLNGTAFGELREMFLFRPYDKATIWEQQNLVCISASLKARVFLWECMGLTPSYVRVLQQDWMRDDISTITNTYPDHEDVQGPAGRNIPEVMTEFIPTASILLTTEEEMLPILSDGASLKTTRMRPVGWKEAGLIHQQLLDRFPYAEHPSNIALVTAMADELAIAPDYAVKEMADRVVADLGVLKIYPRANVYGRTLEFVMGMSANERFGAMGNWDRMGFAKHGLSVDPDIYVTTVVNNRADRVPRSRVFARMLVEDISADRHFLIGSNIDGLIGFIDEAWAEHAATISLFDPESTPLAVLEAHALRHRIPISADQVVGRMTVLEGAEKDHGEAITSHRDELSAQLADYEALKQAIATGGDSAALDSRFKNFLRTGFMSKLVPVHDYYTSGEDIIRLIAKTTPPGLTNRILGMQNIKGTGLDFVYRWQAWEACHRACQQALGSDPGTAATGIDMLAGFEEHGVLTEKHVRAAIISFRDDPTPRSAMTTSQLDAVIQRLDAQMAALDKSTDGAAAKGGDSKMMTFLEAVLDSHDAISRRRKSERIYKAMIDEQISSQRAALELKKLTARQKGGWLAMETGRLSNALTRLFSWRRQPA